MSLSLQPILGRIHELAGALDDGPSDAELLARIARDGDAEAFGVVLKRHGGLVWRVCRRVLDRRDGAEDAFQATFLVLLRRAGAIRKSAALGSWLHGVALRIALRARKRAPREQLPAPATSPRQDPAFQAACRELGRILEEEVARLPERLRLPVLLCYWEGKTNEEAARRLDWPAGTVKTRLAKAREMLQRRLTRRGVTLPAGAVTVLLTPTATEAMPALLAATTAKLIHGSGTGASATILALAESAMPATLLMKLRAVAVLAVAFLALAGMRAVTLSEPPTAIAQKESVDSPKPGDQGKRTRSLDAEPRRITLEGRVLDGTGKPVGNSTVSLRELSLGRLSSSQNPAESRDLATVRPDAKGVFSFRNVLLPPPLYGRQRSLNLDVIVQAPGHALAWRHLDAAAIGRPLELTLAPQARVKGRLLDRDNKPLANVALRVSEVASLDHPWLAPLGDPDHLDLRWWKTPLISRSDAAGRFELHGLPQNARVILTVVEPGYARQDILIATTDRPQPPLVTQTKRKSAGLPELATVHHGDFTVHVDKAFQLHAQVVFDDTGEPALGARWAEPPIFSPANRDTDAMARLAVNQLAAGKFRLRIFPPENSDYLGVETHFDLQGEPRLLRPTIRLPRGVILRGRVLEEKTGRAISAAELEYFQDPPDASEGATRPFAYRTRANTQGMFQIGVPPTKGNLVLLTVPRGYRGHELQSGQSLADAGSRFLKTFDASGNNEIAPLEFTVGRGAEVHVNAQAPDGSAVRITHVEERELNPDRQVLWKATPTGQLQLSGLRPGADYQFALIASGSRLAALVDIAAPDVGAKPTKLRTKLEPMASLGGRVIDESGAPITNAVVRIHEWRRTRAGQEFGSVTRDPVLVRPDGTFLWKELVPGVKYEVSARAEGYVGDNNAASNDISWTAEPGQVHMLPDLLMAHK